MNHYKNTDRKESLKRLIPELFNYKSILYIGAKGERFEFGKEFRDNNCEVSVLEIFPPNVQFLKSVSWLEEVIQGDVRMFETDKKYDVVFWWHGPEHIHIEELPVTLNKLKEITERVIVIGCPWGIYEQGEIKGNLNEIHVSHLGYQFFEEQDFEVECLGEENVEGSNITAIWRKQQ